MCLVPPVCWWLCWVLDPEDVLTVRKDHDPSGIWPGLGGRRGGKGMNIYQVMYFMSSFLYIISCNILSDATRLIEDAFLPMAGANLKDGDNVRAKVRGGLPVFSAGAI